MNKLNKNINQEPASMQTASGGQVEPLVRQGITDIEKNYNELIMAVQRKFTNETRHQTALRYINEAENLENNGCGKNTDSNLSA